MRKVTQIMLLVAVVMLGLVGCTTPGSDTTISISDHSDALTTGGTDNLFILTLTKASKAYAPADLQITANLAGQTAMVMNFSLNDTNGNGSLDAGESLTCIEPGVNTFDQTTVGQAVSVSFEEKQGGNSVLLLDTGTWTPAN